MDNEQTPTPEPTQITITFGPGHHVELAFAGPITSYMMLGAAGILIAQANAGIEDAIRRQSPTLETVQRLPVVRGRDGKPLR